jgi:hypothetical protein
MTRAAVLHALFIAATKRFDSHTAAVRAAANGPTQQGA